MFVGFLPHKHNNVDETFCTVRGSCGSSQKAEEDANYGTKSLTSARAKGS